jgi:hypothetical protein
MGSIYGSQPIVVALDPHLKWHLEPGGYFQSVAGIQNCTKPSLGIKADNHGYQKNTWF